MSLIYAVSCSTPCPSIKPRGFWFARLVVIGAAGLLAIAGPTPAQQGVDPPASLAPTNRGSADDEIKSLVSASEKGDPEAQFKLGLAFERGEGVTKNTSKAIKWYSRAAEQGHAGAQCNLAEMYAAGTGVPKDEVEAVKWFRLAAEQGDANGQHGLGIRYLVGEGVAKNPTEALKWLRRAAEQGNAAMQWMLGSIYDQANYDVPRDAKEAAKWYRLAAEQGLWLAQTSLGRMYARGDGVPKDYVLAYFWVNVGATVEKPTSPSKSPSETQRQATIAAEKTRTLLREYRDSLAQAMTAEQIAEAQRLSREFKPKPWRAIEENLNPAGDLEADVSGSGFFITPDGYFVTNHHIVVNARRVRVQTTTGMQKAIVVRHDSANDLALLKMEGTFSALHVRASTAVRSADQVFTVGYPNPQLQGIVPKFSSGEVAALTGPADDPRLFQISVPVQPGNSGGPLVDATGSVVGVVVGQLDKISTLKATGNLPENVNYAVKSTLLLALLESVPELRDKLLEPSGEVRGDDRASIGQRVEKATGLVLVDR